MRIPITVIVITGLLFSVPAMAQKLKVEKIPDWVTRNNYDYKDAPASNDIDDGCLDMGLEQQVNINKKAVFFRRAVRIITNAGIQNRSEVSVSYDPGYQRVAFHQIQIIRNGKHINKLALSKIKTIQQETELSRSIYNGSLTSMLFLEDVRVGDIIEYSYTLYGFNPVFNGKFAETLDVQYSVPVEYIFYKLICPVNRPLTIKNNLTAVKPLISQLGPDNIYEWRLAHVAALKMQDLAPSWYDPYPVIMVSEYNSWKEVNDWASSLFSISTPLSGGLQHKIGDINSSSSSIDEKIIKALRFVQDDVRYLGIEMSVHSHKPHAPNKIFAQRFGDCKDKSLLLCTILKGLGVDASPVLLNTRYKHALTQRLPSPAIFDHGTVRVRLNNKSYWFDPTITYQRGRLNDISYPDYQCGLIITDTTTTLTDIPLQDNGHVVAKEDFLLGSTGAAATFTVTTTYTGSFADDVRNEIKSGSITDIEKNYLNFYNHFYKDIKQRDSLKVHDNDTTGVLTTYEYYTIKKIWKLEKETNKASFYGLLINSILKKPEDHDRTMPITLTYPARYTEEIDIHVNEPWNFEFAPTTISSPSFTFTSHGESTSRSVHLTYKYNALKDHIAENDAANFFSDYDKAKEELSYELTKSNSVEDIAEVKKTTTPNAPVKLLGYIVFLGVLVAGGIFRAKRK